ncbi:hypothetical protein P9857_05875 [Anoxybacillus geothermalis]|uniref:hypothetical protein n=1 Tax=Geobacillus TaxID=129337 RepID=UPI000501360F|nr:MULTISPECIES: hypothetical protein [unclassified Geobacillus]AKM18094.1 hypothetical protein GARCT_00796 [Geobacillus sp. 12AMOR1]AKU27394.1 hypothetical protein IB49_14435 [Geobacillus sp. LC300]ASS88097.1 hypothetical protein GLN3_14365 [Geobacillus lituanicus]KFL15698.1 hypothetical protein ET31_10590 [Geobacillus stearothermophilus]MED0655218.1 hypothetical protein [Anoxybacillus geothermalis]NNU98868.1 hypothetical protein [Geobacillus sp. DSP4a]STO36208.1 Uncharacterised protein [[F
MKKRIVLCVWAAAAIAAFFLNLLGLMRLLPLWATMPLLFLTLLGLVASWNRRRQFKGFSSKRLRL